MLMKNLLFILSMSICSVVAFAQGEATESIITFKFAPGSDFFIWEGNDEQLNELYALVDRYRSEIISGRMPVYIDGYCASLSNAKENIEMAFVRANRVKSELITNKDLLEEHFITGNHATAYEGYKDMVVVTLRIPAKDEPRRESKPESGQEPKPEVKPEPRPEPKPEPVAETTPERMPEPEPVDVPQAAGSWHEPYFFALRTNLLYDAFLLPALGAEWRVNGNIGIKIDGGLAWWSSGDKVQKMWLVNPEIRWYIGASKRFYLGVGGNYGEYNTCGYLLGKLYPDNTGYQGKLYGGGLTAGYQARLTRRLLFDLNLGLGVIRTEYDSFYIKDGVRTYDQKDQTKNFWGPTQAGVSLVWIFRNHQQ